MTSDFSPPIYEDKGPAPTGVCSRWMGDSPCGAAGTHHVIWDYDMRNGCICAAHVAEAREKWVYVGLHPYGEACASAGIAIWDEAADRCVMPSGAELQATASGATA